MLIGFTGWILDKFVVTSNNCKDAAVFTGGVSDYLPVPTSNSFPLTISFWMRLTSDTGSLTVGGLRSDITHVGANFTLNLDAAGITRTIA
jgi:hypothetical protein